MVDNELEVLDPMTPPEEHVDLPQRQSGGFFRRLIAFVLGMIFGIVALGASLFYIAGYVKIKKAANVAGKFVGFNFEELVEKDYVSEALGDETVIQLLANLGYAAKQQELAWFCDYFPILNKYIDEFVTNLNEGFGIEMETDVLLTTPLKELPTYLSDLIQNAELGKVMKAVSETGELDPLMMELSYGHKGENYYFDENGEVVMIPPSKATTIGMMGSDTLGILDNILLSHVIQEKQNNNIIMYLLYGKEGVEYEMRDDPASPTGRSAKMLQMQIAVLNGKVYDFYGAEMEAGYTWNEETKTYTDEDGAKHILDLPVQKDGVNATVKTEDGAIAPLYYVKDEEGKPIYFKETTVGDMDEENCHFVALTKRMTLGEMIGEEKIGENKILKHLSNCTLNNVADELNALSFGDVFENDIYLTYENETSMTDKNGNAINKGDFIYYVDNEDGTRDTYLATSAEQYVVKGVWKYMLKAPAESENESEADRIQRGLDYSITNDMTKIMDNMATNMKDATLQELSDDGIIEMSKNDLNTSVPSFVAEHSGKKLGDLTVNQMLSVMITIINKLDEYGL